MRNVDYDAQDARIKEVLGLYNKYSFSLLLD
jgi:hypothetical protein